MKTSLGAKTLLYPAPVMVVGTYNEHGQANIMTAAWGGIACSRPPCISISLRSATASHAYIVSRKAFTISLPSRAYAAQADYIGLVSGRNHNKFEELGLTPVASTLVDAPYVSEFPLVLECRLVATHELGLHTQFVGEVMDVKVDEKLVTNKGKVNIEELDPILFMPDSGLYYGLGTLIGEAFSIGKDMVQHKDKA
jgi:flavin reductase (DIM6/NTAB) family NADH-FMN oxidoreductase RutF